MDTNETQNERPMEPFTQVSGSAFLVYCNAYSKESLEYKTISEALADNRIVSVTKEDDGRFCVEEGCDKYFRGYLTREQLLAWSDELRALAGMPNEQVSGRLAQTNKEETTNG